MIKIYTDGSATESNARNPWRIKQAGWGFVIVSNDIEIMADSGSSLGKNSGDGELLAILNGLLALTTSTEVEIVTDYSSAKYLANTTKPEELLRMRLGNPTSVRHCYLKRAIRGLCMFHTVKITHTPRMIDHWAKRADNLARGAIDLYLRGVEATIFDKKQASKYSSIEDYESRSGKKFVFSKKHFRMLRTNSITEEEAFEAQRNSCSVHSCAKGWTEDQATLPNQEITTR